MEGILARFRTVTTASPERPAFIDATCSGVRQACFSYGEVAELAAGLAGALTRRDLTLGDRVAVVLPNGIDFVLLYLACLHAGLTIVPVNPNLAAEEIEHSLRLTRPRLIVVRTKDTSRLQRFPAPLWMTEAPGDILAAARHHEQVPCAAGAHRLFSITFTSGTTSRPKGVAHSVENLLANAASFNRLAGFERDARLLHVLPMSYMAGFLNTLLSPLMAGATVILAPAFDAQAALRFWEPAIRHRATTLWISPTIAAALCRLDRDAAVRTWTRANLSSVFVGTAPLPAPVKHDFEGRFGVELFESYGLTEFLLVSANTPLRDRANGSVGPLLEGVEIGIRSENGDPLEEGGPGDLWIRSSYALNAYLTEAGDAPPAARDGWMPTGDLGMVDRCGNLVITGRRKDLIIRGGVNVSPRAIEDVLLSHPSISDAAVIGAPHAFWGEQVVALVSLKEHPGAAARREELLSLCRDRLALPPDHLFGVEKLPRTLNGKLNKAQIREAFLSGTLTIFSLSEARP